MAAGKFQRTLFSYPHHCELFTGRAQWQVVEERALCQSGGDKFQDVYTFIVLTNVDEAVCIERRIYTAECQPNLESKARAAHRYLPVPALWVDVPSLPSRPNYPIPCSNLCPRPKACTSTRKSAIQAFCASVPRRSERKSYPSTTVSFFLRAPTIFHAHRSARPSSR